MMPIIDGIDNPAMARAFPGRLAPHASRSERSRGRLHPQSECPIRTAFQRDRDRILHAEAFRRLTYKTQVFIYHEGDHYRTRLTHSLEVAQIARTLARTLRLDEDLAETIALAHDLGHTPFGHAGEDALNRSMRAHGGFDHNAQSLRIVTQLENRYAGFDGLNLTWETLEGLVKHNGPLLAHGQTRASLAQAVALYNARHDLELDTNASAEAQLAALADDIAYNNHDIDDGLRAGLIALDQVRQVPLVGRLIREVEKVHGGLAHQKIIYEVNRRLITAMINDVLCETTARLGDLRPQSVEDIRNAPQPVVSFSPQMTADLAVLRAFLFDEVYRHPRIAEVMQRSQQILVDLFDHYMANPDDLAGEWRDAACAANDTARARCVCDFIAGMTDRHALRTHKRLFDAEAELG
jgi:dGTPase